MLIILTLFVTIFFFKEYNYYIEKAGLFRFKDVVVGTLAFLLSFEACRRVLGWPLPTLVVIGLLYVLWGSYVPGPLGHRGFKYSRAIGQVFSFNGIYGEICGVYSTYVMLFVIFGAVIQACGMSDFLLRLSNCLVGRLKGGTAKTAIVSSGTIGMVIGSGAANVAVTGSFTIPLMKSVGYPPHVAGAIETVASAGGVLMPPIMGSAAFILATYTDTPYRDVILVSFLPAILFYWGMYIQIHFLSWRLGIQSAEKGEPLSKVLKDSGHMLIPILVIFVLIIIGMTPYRAGIWGIAVTFLLHFLRPVARGRMSLAETFFTFGEGAKLQLSVGASAGIIGAIIVLLVLPGLPLKLASYAAVLSGGNLLVMLFLMMIVSYIFGMGIPMVAAYIILAVIAVPALIELGVPLFTAHLIIMWFSLASLWTPPVAVGAFVASGIARASANKIGWYSVRLGIGLYVIPLLMAYGTIINGTLVQILFAAVCVALGLYGFGASIEGFTKMKLKFTERSIYMLSAVLMIYPITTTRLIGMGIFAFQFYIHHRDELSKKAGPLKKRF